MPPSQGAGPLILSLKSVQRLHKPSVMDERLHVYNYYIISNSTDHNFTFIT